LALFSESQKLKGLVDAMLKRRLFKFILHVTDVEVGWGQIDLAEMKEWILLFDIIRKICKGRPLFVTPLANIMDSRSPKLAKIFP
jgi:hypothetical protein